MEADAELFMSNVGSEYASAVVLGSKDKMNGTEARHWAL
jgi:hypothetical protein